MAETRAEDLEAVWRTLLWDGAPEALVRAMARDGVAGLAQVTPSRLAGWAAEGALETLEDWLELLRLAERDRERRRAAAGVREAARLGLPRLLFAAPQPGLVQVRVRRDLRGLDWFALAPREAAWLSGELMEAAQEAAKGRAAPDDEG